VLVERRVHALRNVFGDFERSCRLGGGERLAGNA
jgi:hypothetical protein